MSSEYFTIKNFLLLIIPFLAYFGMQWIAPFSFGNYAVGEVYTTQVDANKTIITADVKGEHFLLTVYYEPIEAQYFLFEKGDNIVFKHITNADRQNEYIYIGRYSLPLIVATVAMFFSILILFFGSSVLYPFLSLLISLVAIIYGIIPAILHGYSVFFIGILGLSFLLFFSILISQGFTRSSFIAAVASIFSLIIAYFLGDFAVKLLSLFGYGGSSISYIASEYPLINLQGVFVIGVYLGVIGVIDDVAATQATTIEELSIANKNTYSFRELYDAGMNVGKSHIFSMVNTLVFAYLGSNIAAYLYLSSLHYPIWVFLSTPTFTEEFVRIFIGSFSILFTIPLTSLLATWYYKKYTKVL